MSAPIAKIIELYIVKCKIATLIILLPMYRYDTVRMYFLEKIYLGHFSQFSYKYCLETGS